MAVGMRNDGLITSFVVVENYEIVYPLNGRRDKFAESIFTRARMMAATNGICCDGSSAIFVMTTNLHRN